MNEYCIPEKLIDEPQESKTATHIPINELIQSDGSVVPINREEPQVSTKLTHSSINELIESDGSVVPKHMKDTRSKSNEVTNKNLRSQKSKRGHSRKVRPALTIEDECFE